jgi:hypothetical protein
MSDDFHRPTLTFPNGAYNATQVRLYGVGYPWSIGSAGKPGEISVGQLNLSVAPKNAGANKIGALIKGSARAEANLDRLEEYLEEKVRELTDDANIVYHVQVTTKSVGIVVVATAFKIADHVLGAKFLSPGLIVGYSYEGHCYDLPKPKLMIIPTYPEYIPDDDCGYDRKRGEHYRVWILDKLAECAEIDVSQGFVEQLVLEANLPGKRSPTMYAGRMMLGHRSGRLTE